MARQPAGVRFTVTFPHLTPAEADETRREIEYAASRLNYSLHVTVTIQSRTPAGRGACPQCGEPTPWPR